MKDIKESSIATPMTTVASIQIQQGTCYAVFAYDIALSINLDETARLLSTASQRGSIKRQHPAPTYFEYHPAPVRVTQEMNPLPLGAYLSSTGVDIMLYDFGAASVKYSIPLTGPLVDLCTLSEELYNNERLLADSRQRVEKLLAAIPSALTKPNVAALVEDYVIFHLESFDPLCPIDTLRTAYAPVIARWSTCPFSLSTFTGEMVKVPRSVFERLPDTVCYAA